MKNTIRISSLALLLAMQCGSVLAEDLEKYGIDMKSSKFSKFARKKMSGPEIAKLAEKSAGEITLNYVTMAASGTGFFVAKGIIATNHHVIKLGIPEDAKIWIGNKDNHRLLYHLGNVLAEDPEHDVALVEVHESTMFHTSTALANVAPLALSNYQDEQVGDPIFIYGNLERLSNTFSKGIISSFRDEKGGALSTNSGTRLQYDAAVTHGSSGGPIFNENGEVIGIVTSGIGEANLNFGTPVSFIGALLDKVRPGARLTAASAMTPDKVTVNNLEIPAREQSKKFVSDDVVGNYFAGLGAGLAKLMQKTPVK